jgi:hypothetical protein
MFRRTLFVGVGALTLLWVLGSPAPLSAQKGTAKGPPVFRPGGLPPAPIPPKPGPAVKPIPPKPGSGIHVLPSTKDWHGHHSDHWGKWPHHKWHGHDWRHGREFNPNNNNNNNSSSSSSSSSGSGGSSGGSSGGFPFVVGPGGAGAPDTAGRFAAEIIGNGDAPLRPKETLAAERARIARRKLALARQTTELSEMTSGYVLNILLDDLRTFIDRSAPSSTPLSEEILTRINVTIKENEGNLGLLRYGGNVTWPPAFESEAIVSKKDRAEVELLAKAAVQQAMQGYLRRPDMTNLQSFVQTTGEKLSGKVTQLPGGQYLDAKRFLHNFDAARIALASGEAVPYFKFQKWVSGGKSIQQVTAYMVQEGLLFAAATPGDESAYRAMHSALAAYDVEVNASSTASYKDRP